MNLLSGAHQGRRLGLQHEAEALRHALHRCAIGGALTRAAQRRAQQGAPPQRGRRRARQRRGRRQNLAHAKSGSVKLGSLAQLYHDTDTRPTSNTSTSSTSGVGRYGVGGAATGGSRTSSFLRVAWRPEPALRAATVRRAAAACCSSAAMAPSSTGCCAGGACLSRCSTRGVPMAAGLPAEPAQRQGHLS